MSGLGAVFPPVTAGTLGPASPLSYTTNMINGYIGGNAATVYSNEGILAPYLTGLYQVNITIPTDATAGDNAFEITGTGFRHRRRLPSPLAGPRQPSVRPSNRSAQED